MFFGDEKKMQTMIKGRRDHRGERLAQPVETKPEIMKTEDGEVDGRHQAMEDFMAAHQERSPMKMADAMSNFIHLHNAKMAAESAEGD